MRAQCWLVGLALLSIGPGPAGSGPGLGEATALDISKPPLRQELGAMSSKAAPVALATEPVTVNVVLHPESRPVITAALPPSSNTKLLLTVEGIAFDKRPEVHYEAYVNLPRNETPDPKSIYFAGTLSFFLSHGSDAQSFDITRIVREQESRKLWDDAQASVTFVMRWLVDRNGKQLPVPPGQRARFSNLRIVAVSPQP